jgi:nicotinamide mononucleotide transporter
MKLQQINTFIKKELSGWKKEELAGIFIVLAIIIYNAVVLKDSAVAITSAVCGILYTVIAGKGKISCYLFGLTGSSFYGYLAFSNALWGNLLLYVGYYIPMQILGIFKWKKNLKKETN